MITQSAIRLNTALFAVAAAAIVILAVWIHAGMVAMHHIAP
jgi:hypothetical protein